MTSLSDLDYSFEPVEFCDLTLLYQGSRFRVHKCVLVANSTYFSALLKGDLAVNEVSLPGVPVNGTNSIWSPQLIKVCFSCFYRYRPLTVKEFIYTGNDDRVNFDVMVDFCDYFACARFEEELQAVCLKFVDLPLHSRTFVLSAIRRLERMRWKDLLGLCVQEAGQNLKAIQKSDDYDVRIWNLLSEAMQSRILQVAEKNDQITVNGSRP